MKANSLFIKQAGLIPAFLAIVVLFATPYVWAQGTDFTYQGQLNDASTPANGYYDFEFEVWDSLAGGFQVGSTIVQKNILVEDGLFTVILDFGSGIFTGADLWLQVGVQTNGGGGFTILAPRTYFTSTPYAIRAISSAEADIATSVPVSSIGSAEVVNNSLTSSDLGPNSVGTSEVINESLLAEDLAPDSVTASEIAAGAVGTSEVADGSLTTTDLNLTSVDARYVEVTGDTMTGDLDIVNAGNEGDITIENTFPFVTLNRTSVSGNSGLAFKNDGAYAGWFYLRGSDGALALSAGTESTVQNSLVITPEDRVGIGRLPATYGFEVEGDVGLYDSDINIYASDGDRSVFINGDSYGYQYLYNSEGVATMYLLADSGNGAYMSLRNTNGSTRVALDGYGYNTGGSAYFYAADGSTTVELHGEDPDNSAGLIQVNNNLSATRAEIFGENASGGGQVSLYESGGDESCRLACDSYGGELRLYDEDGAATVLIDSSSGNGGYATWYQADGQNGVFIDGDSSGAGLQYVYNAAGSARIILDGDVSGDGRITCDELQINGGSDLSEQFDIEAAPEPGTVVCIDPENPGKLVVSSKAYDRKVAGIVSGAGGVKPGMMMGQDGTIADGLHPVALSGRVYCKVDASHGAIQPGDLITTSDVPGCGMKVTDFTRAHGAIIGKAMTGLESGQGLVLVLVSLQ